MWAPIRDAEKAEVGVVRSGRRLPCGGEASPLSFSPEVSQRGLKRGNACARIYSEDKWGEREGGRRRRLGGAFCLSFFGGDSIGNTAGELGESGIWLWLGGSIPHCASCKLEPALRGFGQAAPRKRLAVIDSVAIWQWL